jgi:hypothetical protein
VAEPTRKTLRLDGLSRTFMAAPESRRRRRFPVEAVAAWSMLYFLSRRI